MSHIKTKVAICIAQMCVPLAVAAQDITLSSQDGSISMSGDLLNYDGHFYRIDTEFGPLTIDGAHVTCEGPACPNIFEFTPNIQISTHDPLIARVLHSSILAFGHSLGAKIEIENGQNGTPSHYAVINTHADRIEARFTLKQQPMAKTVSELLTYDIDLAYAFEPLTDIDIDTLKAADLGDFARAPWRSSIAQDAWVAVGSTDTAHKNITLDHLETLIQTNPSTSPDALALTLFSPQAEGEPENSPEDGAKPQMSQIIGRYTDIGDLQTALAQDPFAIGMVRLSDAQTTELMALAIHGSCGRGYQITREAIKGDLYPHTLPLIAYRPARSLPSIATAFTDFLRSPDGHQILRSYGLVDPSFETVSLSQQGDRLVNTLSALSAQQTQSARDMVAYLSDKRRLSSALRFAQGQTQLTQQSKDQLTHIIRLIQSGSLDGQHLHFLGFSDATGDYETNVELSKKRADTAMSAVLAELALADIEKVNMSAAGFGPLMPILCDDTEAEQNVNRRVEIWIAPASINTPPSEN